MRDRAGVNSLDQRVGHGGDGDLLWCVPIRRREDQGCPRGVYLFVGADRHGYVVKRFAGEHHRIGIGGAALDDGGRARRFSDGYAGRIVVGEENVQEEVALIVGIGAERVQQNLGVVCSLENVVVNRGDTDRLGCIPVGRRECEKGVGRVGMVNRRDLHVGVGQEDRHVGLRLGVQLDGERVGNATLGHYDGPGRLDNSQTGGVVIRDSHGEIVD